MTSNSGKQQQRAASTTAENADDSKRTDKGGLRPAATATARPQWLTDEMYRLMCVIYNRHDLPMSNRGLMMNFQRAYALFTPWIDRFQQKEYYVFSMPSNPFDKSFWVFGIAGLLNIFGYGNFGAVNPKKNDEPMSPDTPVKCKFSWSLTVYKDESDMPKDLFPTDNVRRAWFRYIELFVQETEALRIRLAQKFVSDPRFFPQAKAACAAGFWSAYPLEWAPYDTEALEKAGKTPEMTPEYVKAMENKMKELQERMFVERFSSPIRRYHPKKYDNDGKLVPDMLTWKKSIMFSAPCFKRVDEHRQADMIKKAADALAANPVLGEKIAYTKDIKVHQPVYFLGHGTTFMNQKKREQESGHFKYTPPILQHNDGRRYESVPFMEKNLFSNSAIAHFACIKLYDSDKGWGFRFEMPNDKEETNCIKVIATPTYSSQLPADDFIDYIDADGDEDYRETDANRGKHAVVDEINHASSKDETHGPQKPDAESIEEKKAVQQESVDNADIEVDNADDSAASEVKDDDSADTKKYKKRGLAKEDTAAARATVPVPKHEQAKKSAKKK